jgi:hypothetical protein
VASRARDYHRERLSADSLHVDRRHAARLIVVASRHPDEY